MEKYYNTHQFICVLLLLSFGFLFAQNEQLNYHQQVPVCAPIPPAGSQVSPNPEQRRDQGVPGKKGIKGDQGEMGSRGYPGYPWGSGGCPGVTFHLPRDDQVTDYVRYRSYVPSLKELTMCTWIESSDFDSHNTFISYAIPSTDNEFFVWFHSPTTLRIHLGGPNHDITIDELAGLQKFHICVWFSSTKSQLAVYFNGTRNHTRSIAVAQIRGGGDMILGQEQDAPDAGRLDANQAFSGNITNLMIWPRVLSDQEINDIANLCVCPFDYSVAMTMDRVELHGEAGYSTYNECPTL